MPSVRLMLKKSLLVVLCISAVLLFTITSKDFAARYLSYVNILPLSGSAKHRDPDYLPYFNISYEDTPQFLTASTTPTNVIKTPTLIQQSDVTDVKFKRQCRQPTTHVLFLKTHKTGSSTITNILNRFADSYNLTMLLPRRPSSYSFHWPNKFSFRSAAESLVRPNILANHARYSRSTMNILFPRESTFYVTILRDPVPQFESSFQYFSFAQLLGINRRVKDPLTYFLDHPNTNDQVQAAARKYSTANLIRNPLFYDLGFDYKDSDNSTFVQNAIQTLAGDFDLVLLMEHFDESLTLLRRRLCWDVDDVVYFKLNERLNKNRRKSSLSNQNVAKIRRWNNADSALYDYFKERFWEEVQKEGSDFQNDVSKLKARRLYYSEICIEDEAVEEAYSSVYVKGYKMRNNLRGDLKQKCEQMLRNEIKFLDYFRSKQSKSRAMASADSLSPST